jgi:chemotaxis protein CheC
MTSGPIMPLTDIERDALGELSNIAMARAANSLRQMVEYQVLLSVPSVDIVSKEAATQLIAKPDSPTMVAIRQDFSGAFSGRALLIFPEASSLELVRIVVGQQLPLEDIGNLEDEALAETGNIILNSWVATIANLLKSGLKMSLPTVVRGDSRQMFRGDESQSLVLFLHIRFEISMKEIRGYVALLMDIPSVEELRSLIADFISNSTQAGDGNLTNFRPRADLPANTKVRCSPRRVNGRRHHPIFTSRHRRSSFSLPAAPIWQARSGCRP